MGRAPVCRPIARALVARAMERVSNDNRPQQDQRAIAAEEATQKLLRAALMHFSEHGLAAGRLAGANADAALQAGDVDAFDHWLGITRMLDRPLARRVERLRTPA